MEDVAARLHRRHVLDRGGRIHAHCDFVQFPPCQESFAGHPDGIPGRQSLDVGGEDVLAGNRDAHVEQGMHQDQIAGLAAGTVGGSNSQGEVVDDAVGDRQLRNGGYLFHERNGR